MEERDLEVTKTLVVIGTLDTKGPEIAYLVKKILYFGSATGVRVLVVDSGMLGEPMGITPDITRDEVAQMAGLTIEDVRKASSRGEAVGLMSKGVVEVVGRLFREGRCDGIVSLGGAEGSALACAAMEALPVGIPKILATPLASGPRPFSFFVDTKDIIVMHSVVDILGINAVSRRIYDIVAGAAVGAVQASATVSKAGNLVAVTMLGNTTRGVMHLKRRLEELGYELVVFHSSGIGGRAMERMAEEGFFCGVVDYTTNEVFEDLVGGLQRGAGPNRLTVVGRLGIPQVVVPGCVDFFDQGPLSDIPDKWRTRKLYCHSPSFTLVRLTKKEMSDLGEIFAERLNLSQGPTIVAYPLLGTSIPNHPGGVFWDEEADRAFLTSLKANLRDDIKVVEVSAHINDSGFVDVVAALFQQVMARKGKGVSV